MKPSLKDPLCTCCGLCCDGSLFADVELAGSDEAAALEVMGLEIGDAEEDDGGLLLQPCRALKGKRCSIYPHRPDCCRTFECRLLQEVRRGTLGVKRAQANIAGARMRIEHMNKLLAQLGQATECLPLKERCAEALAGSEAAGADRETIGKRAKLEAAMTSLEELIQKSFLGG